MTPVDRRVLVALPRYGWLSFSQIERWFYGSMKRASERLTGMVECGLLHRQSNERWAGGLYWLTNAGLRLAQAESVLPLPRQGAVPSEQLLHRLAVNDVLLQAESAGLRTVTEREIRALESGAAGVDPGSFLAALGARGVKPVRMLDVHGQERSRWLVTGLDRVGKTHVPDGAVVAQDGRLVAVEVEFAVKERQRAVAILRSYRNASPFDSAVYYCSRSVELAFLGSEVAGTGRWRDGYLQDSRLVPSGRLTVEGARQSPVKLQSLTTMDVGVSWMLATREIPPRMYLSKAEYVALVGRWRQHESAVLPSGARMPFVQWYTDVWPKVMAADQALTDEYAAAALSEWRHVGGGSAVSASEWDGLLDETDDGDDGDGVSDADGGGVGAGPWTAVPPPSGSPSGDGGFSWDAVHQPTPPRNT